MHPIKKYPKSTYIYNSKKSVAKLMIGIFVLVLILTILHWFGIITWSSQELTDAQTTPFVFGLIIVSAYITWRAYFRFDGFILLDKSIVQVKTNIHIFKNEYEYEEHKYSDIKTITLARLEYFKEHSYKLKCTEIDQLIAENANIMYEDEIANVMYAGISMWTFAKLQPVLMFLLASGNCLVFNIGTLSKKQLKKLSSILESSNVNFQLDKKVFSNKPW
jgi:hypothetical protein